jgi:hypothetical protein
VLSRDRDGNPLERSLLLSKYTVLHKDIKEMIFFLLKYQLIHAFVHVRAL